MHSPSKQNSKSPQALKHIPQCSAFSCVSTQTPSQTSSPGPVQSPPVDVCVVLGSVSAVVPPVSLVDDGSLPDDVSLSEVDVEVDVVGSDDDGFVVVGSAVDVDVGLFVLDIESIPVDDALIASLVDVVVVSPPPSSPPQAHRARPTSAEITAGAAPWTEQGDQQNGQRRSLSRT